MLFQTKCCVIHLILFIYFYSYQGKFIAFTKFSEKFVEIYSSVIDLSSDQIKTTSSKIPTIVEDTEGHPSSVIVQVTCLFTELLIKADTQVNEFEEHDSSFEKRRMKKTDGLLSSDTYHVSGIRYALENEEGSRDKVVLESETCSIKTAEGRRGILLLLQTLSILVHWEHNKIIFQSRLGSTFATNFIGAIRCLINQLDGLVVSWVSVKEHAIDVEHAALSDLRDDTSFVFSALVLISQFIAKSCPSIVDISQKTHCGFLPPQPWRMAELQAFGYSSLFEQDEEQDSPSSHRRSRLESADESLSDTSAPILNAFCSGMQPLLSNFKQDAWCGMLIAAGADYVIIDIVRKLSNLSKMLALSPAPSPKRSASQDPEEEEEYVGSSGTTGLTTEEKWTITAYDIWKKCVVLQNEVLFALIGLVATHPVATSNRFLVCEGAQALNTMLLDSNTFVSRKNTITNSIVFRRGVLCLRLNELVMQHCNESSNINTILIPEALGWVLSWMQNTYNYENEHLILNDDDYLENVVGCVEIPTKEGILSDSDLWPWAGGDSSEEGDAQNSGGKEGHSKQQRKFTNQSYRLCHQVEFGTKKKHAWDDKLNLEEWAIYAENALRDRSDTMHFDLPWFLRGKSSRAWHVVFSILIFTTYTEGSEPIKKPSSSTEAAFDNKRMRSIESFELIISAVFSSLAEVVSRAPAEEDDYAQDLQECVPLFQMHVLLFIARCVHRRPVNVIEYFSDREEIWKQLFGKNMFLGGRRAVVKIWEESTKHNGDTNDKHCRNVTEEDLNKYCILEPLFSYSSVEGTTDDEDTPQKSLTKSFFADGFMWFYVHDSVLDLTTLLIRTANTPPTNRIISTKKGFEIKPIIQALQLSSEKGYDDVTFQLLKWMGWYLDLFSTKSIPTRNFLSSHFFRAALAVCGYQLSDIGAYSILQKDSSENPLHMKEQVRLFMWSSRKAAISLVDFILDLPGCEKWVSLFLSKEQRDESSIIKKDGKGDNSNSPSISVRKTKSKTPAHQTLVVLLLDNHLRYLLLNVILKILERLMKEVTSEEGVTEVSNEDETRKRFFLQSRILVQSDSDKALLSTAKQTTVSIHSKLCSQAIKDIFSDLFEHVKCASRQPEWFQGWHAV